MTLVDDIQVIRNNPDMSDEEKQKAVRKLRRKARVPKAPEELPVQDLMAPLLQAASALPLYDPKAHGGYAFSLKAAVRTPGTSFDTLKGVFSKRLGYEPQVHAVITLPWDTLLLLGPVK